MRAPWPAHAMVAALDRRALAEAAWSRARFAGLAGTSSLLIVSLGGMLAWQVPQVREEITRAIDAVVTTAVIVIPTDVPTGHPPAPAPATPPTVAEPVDLPAPSGGLAPTLAPARSLVPRVAVGPFAPRSASQRPPAPLRPPPAPANRRRRACPPPALPNQAARGRQRRTPPCRPRAAAPAYSLTS